MHPDLTCQELESTSDRLSAEMCGFCLSIVEGCAVIFVCSTFLYGYRGRPSELVFADLLRRIAYLAPI
jgi:hypothetical protein